MGKANWILCGMVLFWLVPSIGLAEGPSKIHCEGSLVTASEGAEEFRMELNLESSRIETSPGGVRRGALWSDLKGPYYIALASGDAQGLILSVQKEVEGDFLPYIRTTLPLKGQMEHWDHEAQLRLRVDCSGSSL